MAGQEAKPTVVVLGASGLLGTAVARELATRPVRLRLVGRRAPRVPRAGVADVETHRADLTTAGAVAEAVEGADAVIHLAAYMTGPNAWRVAGTDSAAERVNVGTMRALVAAVRAQRRRHAPAVLFSGAMSQCGASAVGRITSDLPDRPLTGYDQQKADAERTLREATREGLTRGATLRLATLYGQGTDPTDLDRGVVAVMARRAFAGQPLTMWDDGTAKRDLLCVDDAARAFGAALDAVDALAGRHWLVGTGQGTSICELFSEVSRSVAACTGGAAVPVVSVPPAAHALPTDRLDLVVDPSAFQSATGWRARVPLAEGVRRACAAVAGEPGVADRARADRL
ncbi:NAD-dependent epimerase/dehydratase family protein [Streptomyces sp. AK010]|uniref:NAD-dependent epimerase/dehydratase family protein n=1 Tax=Streptomyces sp. AK010 TaxID=2723074 RepID=UPI001829E4F5|nr:NAD-dependent epimerase/dehydratase family protein [Streptomyces sp. AK010]MBB6421391.1 dTDP-4-keto-6-deoxyhexose 4-ketoreductase [Streptomyces sp. AK010]